MVESIHDAADGDRTPRATSPIRISQPAQQQQQHISISTPDAAATEPYRGFSSKQAYLDALREWAENKKYEAPSGTSLIGFYGSTTMEEYASRPPAFQGLALRKKWRHRKMSKLAERRATVA